MMVFKRSLKLHVLFVLYVILTWINILFVVIHYNMLSMAADLCF